ncbi:uncharacterized protein C8orf58 homolog isoform X1 [Monodelphis domestica]|uniref:uncharacterized protein C8orf58 homolog isoform X1 n=3 Tax=Monodelphis domestica TaxID=13616 RepID=UPI0024E24432|nr:uncharacterized protein C8orf58 homolog isoform X1 [Monodelphis domestica]
MLGKRRVFTLQPLGSQNGGGCEALLGGCVVLGAKSIYLRVHDMPRVPSPESQDGEGSMRSSGEQASRDSWLEMGGGESPSTAPSSLALDSSNLALGGRPKMASVTMEPPPDLDRFLASRKLEQVVARSCWPRSSPATLPKCWQQREQGSEVSSEVTRDQNGTKAEPGSQAGPAESLALGSEADAWACLPGQGLRYLEHLCLMLERMAMLQQLQQQLQQQHQQMPTGTEGTNESSILAPFRPRVSSVLGPQEFQRLVEKTGKVEESVLPRQAQMHSVSTPSLLEGPAGAAHTIPSYQGHRNNLSHWDKVKALLNRIRWRSPRASEPSFAQDPPAPRRDSKELPEGPLPCSSRRTFLPSLVSKKHRAKNFSVC